MGVPIDEKIWRWFKKAWKANRRKRAAAKRQASRSRTQRTTQTARGNRRPAAPAPARPRPGATPSRTAPARPRRAPAAPPADRTANPLNPVRRYQRWATRTNSRRAASLNEANELRERNHQAIAAAAAAKAEARQIKTARKAARDRAAAEKLAAAQARSTKTQEKPTVIPPRKGLPQPAVVKRAAPQPAQPQTTPGRPTAAPPAAVQCGARTTDGTACQHPVTGDQCAAGHKPKGKPKMAAPAAPRPTPARSTDGLGRPRSVADMRDDLGRPVADRFHTPREPERTGPRAHVASGDDRVDVQVGEVRNEPERERRMDVPAAGGGRITMVAKGNVRVGQQIGQVIGDVSVDMGDVIRGAKAQREARAPRVIIADGNVAVGGRNAFGRDGTVVNSRDDDNDRPEWADDAWKKTAERSTPDSRDSFAAGGNVVFSDGDAAGNAPRTRKR